MLDKLKAFLLRDTAGVPNWGWLIVIAGGIVVAIVVQRRGGFLADSGATGSGETVGTGDPLAGSGGSQGSGLPPSDTALPPPSFDPGLGDEGGQSDGATGGAVSGDAGISPSGQDRAHALARARQQTEDIRTAAQAQRAQSQAAALLRQRQQAADVHTARTAAQQEAAQQAALARSREQVYDIHRANQPREIVRPVTTTSYSTARERHYT